METNYRDRPIEVDEAIGIEPFDAEFTGYLNMRPVDVPVFKIEQRTRVLGASTLKSDELVYAAIPAEQASLYEEDGDVDGDEITDGEFRRLSEQAGP